MLANLIIKMLTKFATEAFLARTAILVLKYLASSTANKFDDEMLKEVAAALGCGDLIK